MQSVVRSSFIGLLAITGLTAGLTACGDKVTQVSNAKDSVVHSVTVSPTAIPNLQVGGSFTLAASVDAGNGITDRTVTWSSSDATIASVDATTGKVTGVKVGGPVTITAASKADPTVKGAAVVTVVSANATVPLVTISSINVTTCGSGTCNSTPANLSNVSGQVDVILNVEPNGQSLSRITAQMKCGNDSVTVTQNVGAASIAELSAEEAAAPVTLSFNTAAFNATSGVPALHNGQCTVTAFATTTGGQQSAVNTTAFTLNNADISVVTVASTNFATDPTNRPWVGGGPLTISALPVMYSGRTPVAATISFTTGTPTTGSTTPAVTSQTLTSLSSGSFSATWSNVSTATPTVAGFAATGISPSVSISDNTGQTTNLVGSVTLKGGTQTQTPANGLFNFDDQKPAAGTFSVTNNPDQGIVGGVGYVGNSFKFTADSASGYRGPNAAAGNQTGNTDNGGVDKVTVVFQFRTNGSTGAYTSVTNTTPITESTSSTSYELRQITLDALGNADTTAAASTLKFGVDKTAPTITGIGGPATGSTSTTGTNGAIGISSQEALSGPGPALVAQVRQWNGLTAATSLGGLSNNEGWVATNVAPPAGATKWGGVGTFNAAAGATSTACVIGRFNVAQSASGPGALPVLSATGTTLGFCTPVVYTLTGGTLISSDLFGVNDGYWYTSVTISDAAGNTSTPVLRTVLLDQTAPTVANIDPPPTATGNSTVAFPASVTDAAAASVGDIVGSWIVQTFANGVSLRFPTTTGPGVAFDNVLTNTANVNPTIPNFMIDLQVNAGGATVPAASASAPTGVTVSALGAANNIGSLSYTFVTGAPQLVAGSTTRVTATTIPLGWTISSSSPTITNCPGADACSSGATQPTTVTLTATAKGPTSTFANPFAGGTMQFWYRPTGGTTWFFAGTLSGINSRDDGTNRFWDYTFSFNPPATAPDGASLTTAGSTIDIAAIGINTAGDAVMTATATITVANP